MYRYHREVLGKEPINITLSPSFGSVFSGFALVNSPESSPTDSPEPDLLPKVLLTSPPAPLFTLSSGLSCAPQGQFMIFLKQALWNKASQDLHFSTSPSC